MKPIEFKTFEVKKAEVGENGKVIGYGAKFGNADRTGDIIHKGAFSKTIMENAGSVILLANHDQDCPIGRVTSMEEDEYGLKFEAKFASTDKAQEYRTLLADGAVDSFSIGYKAIKFDMNSEGGRNLYECKLYEISPVAIPMNPEAKLLEVKNVEELDPRDQILKRFELLAKNVGNPDNKLQLEAEVLKLANEYKQATQPEIKSTEPEVTEEANTNQFLTELKDALKS